MRRERPKLRKNSETAEDFRPLAAQIPAMSHRDCISLRIPAVAFAALLGLACSETKTPTEPVASVASTPTPVPAAGPLGVVHVTFVESISASTHGRASARAGGRTFYVHIEVRETRGIGIHAVYDGLESSGLPYGSPTYESGIQQIRIPAGSVGTTDVLVVTDADVPCSVGLTVFVRISTDDGLTARVPSVFDCTTGYWPL
jgi:hypothetical protein